MRFHHCSSPHRPRVLQTHRKHIITHKHIPLILHLNKDQATYSYCHPSPAALPHQSPLFLASSFWWEASGPGCPLPAPLVALLQFSAPDSEPMTCETQRNHEQCECQCS